MKKLIEIAIVTACFSSSSNLYTHTVIEDFGLFSRALKYSIDLGSNQAVFVRDYSLGGTYSEYTSSGGSFFPLRNGNWLINWARGINDVTEISEKVK